MTQQAYKAFCGDLCKNFDKSWSDVGRKLDFAWEFLAHIPDVAWKAMVKIAVTKWERWPSNWAKSVKEVYEDWRRDTGPINSMTQYDPEEDPRFPVALMWQAFKVLRERGEQEFVTYCNYTRMPANDRERVKNKYRVAMSRTSDDFKLPEVVIRTNPKVNRPDVIRYREPGEDW